MNVPSPTLRKVNGGKQPVLRHCSQTACNFHPAHNEESANPHCPFGVIGLSYKTASVELRGRASFQGDKAKLLLNLLREHGVSEAMILSTCNRTEVYYAGPDQDLVIRLFADASHTAIEELRTHLYMKRGLCASCHLFRVVSGLDSAVLGETEIVAQVKQAWKVSEEFGSCGPGLSLLLQRSMEINKRVRTETDLCRGVTSTATLAVQQAQSRLGSLEGKSVLLLGAGQIAERVCKDLTPLKVASLTILNRTVSRAEVLTSKYGGTAMPMDELESAMADADVVISAVTISEPLINDQLVARVANKRGAFQILIDLGVPANISMTELRGDVEVLNIDALSATCSENLGRRAKAVPVALDILDEEVRRLRADLTVRTAAPTIKALVNQAENIRRQNIDWAMERLTGLNEKERKIVEDLSNRIIKGLLQAPIQGLKHELAAAEHREIISKLFQLEGVDEQIAS